MSAGSLSAPSEPGVSSREDRSDQLDRAATQYWAAVCCNDAIAALAVVDSELASGRALSDVVEGLVAGTQRRVGRLWADGSWSVPQEHAATAVSEYVVRTLLGRAPTLTADLTSTPILLVASAEREWHALPGLTLATLLAHAGHPVRHLGGDVTPMTLQGALIDHPVRAVLLSASLTSSLPAARLLVETAQRVGVATVVGGRAFDESGRRARALGAAGCADSLEQLLRVLDGLDRGAFGAGGRDQGGHSPGLDGPTRHELRLLTARTSHIGRAVVARSLTSLPPGSDLPEDAQQVLADQAPVVVGTLLSALLLDEPALVAEALTWLTRVLAARSDERRAHDTVAELVRALAHELRDYPAALAVLESVAG